MTSLERERDSLRTQLAGPWLVVRAREQYAIEAWQFGQDEAQARAWFDRVGAQWSATFLCRVVAGDGKPQSSMPLHPLEAEAAALRAQLADKDAEIGRLKKTLGARMVHNLTERVCSLKETVWANFWGMVCIITNRENALLSQLEQVQKRLAECEPVVEAVREIQDLRRQRTVRDSVRKLLTERGWTRDTDPRFLGSDRLHPPWKSLWSFQL